MKKLVTVAALAAVLTPVGSTPVVAAVSAIALFVRPDTALMDFLLLIFIFGLFTILATCTWTPFGAALSTWLRDPRHARVFNVAMALLLVASIVPMVL